MLAEMIDRIVGFANKQHEFQSMELPGGRERLVRMPGGEVQRIPIPPAPRHHIAGDLESFIGMLEAVSNPEDASAAVFVTPLDAAAFGLDHDVDSVAICGVFDFEDRRDNVCLMVPFSAALKSLAKLFAPQPQKVVVQELRDSLHDVVDAALLPSFRSLDFSRRSDGSRIVEHGRESLGRSVEAAVRSKHGEIPESIEMDLPIFCGEPFDRFRYRISVSIDIDSASERIRFIPRGDDLGRCFQKAGEYLASEIHERLSGQLVVVGTI